MKPILIFLLFSVKIFSQHTENTDTDGDGIIDRFDKCPKEQGRIEDNGCPKPIIDYKKIEDNRIRQEKQFLNFRQNYNFSQLSDLIISCINVQYVDKEILFMSLKDEYMTDCGGYYSDDLALRFNIINTIWNSDNFSRFIKKINKNTKILTVQSYNSPANFDLHYFPEHIIKDLPTGRIKIKDISGNTDIDTKYISMQNARKDSVIDYDYEKRYGVYSSVYIQVALKDNVLRAIYYYNFEFGGSAKYFKFKNGKWIISSKSDYENAINNK